TNFIEVGINNSFISSLDFNVNVWPYYTDPIIKGREVQVQRDLKNHYANVFVIPSWVLEPNNIVTDHEKLKGYLRYYSAGDKVLLFLNYRSYTANPGNFLQAS